MYVVKICQISKWKVCVWENLTLYWQSDRWLIGLLPTPASFAEETENETKRYWQILRKNIEQKNTENKYWAKKYWEKILSKKYREKYIEKPTSSYSTISWYKMWGNFSEEIEQNVSLDFRFHKALLTGIDSISLY